jgi:protoheme IX farnesyltransferase
MLLLFAAVGGAMLGANGRPSLGALILLVITGTLSSAGASALNQYIEQADDAQMQRTRHRPLVNGLYARPKWVAAVSVGLIALSMGIALLAGNPALAVFLGLGAAIYLLVYTIWLKPRTPLNIVIGGAAGSCAVLSGGAAVGHWADPGVLILSMLVFAWTPTHFWSLSLVYRDDYVKTGVPMLPATTTPHRAAMWMLVHAFATGSIALVLGAHHALGWLYIVPVSLATLWLARDSIRLIAHPERRQALAVFKVSNIYLGLVLLFICIDTLVRL